jgi:hypothetical protein
MTDEEIVSTYHNNNIYYGNQNSKEWSDMYNRLKEKYGGEPLINPQTGMAIWASHFKK